MLRKRQRKLCIITSILILIVTCWIGSYFWLESHSGAEDSNKVTEKEVPKKAEKCQERTNFVYIKMIKCASETLDSMFHRFGLVRQLSYVLPYGNRLYLGWPYQMEETFYRPSIARDGGFNCLSDHSVYSEAIHSIMPVDTVYITSLRDPFSQVKSMFHYYNLKNIMGIESQHALVEYFTNQEKYEKIYKEPNPKRYCVPDCFSMTKNLMSFILGFPTGFYEGTTDQSNNQTAIETWLDKITKRFNLVIIVEYFDESLVLLKRLMCWTFKDILYLSRNVGNYSFKNETHQHLVNQYKEWSKVDYALYERFKQILLSKLEEGGPDLQREVKHYTMIRNKLQTFCDKKEEILVIDKSEWTEEFVLTKPYCDMLQTNLMDTLKAVYDQTSDVKSATQPKKSYC